MALGEAKVKCKAEFQQAVERTGYTLEQIREYVGRAPRAAPAAAADPAPQGVIGRAANFVLHVAS